ncbi:hypothetical protein D9615_001020 [Tricholomella constricta]|uniref:U6 small nuclear RNA (adenine-(43)-N(6))-methyltransferase n=1 Tax=Tricholomella constricta TaxID=117010 RepID=A0A8H5HL57_9AGAR|nr:hypothetical protein D9615_001020 [Tricholomella constricta]
MHSRNPYRVPPDFEAIARAYPPLAKHIQGRTIDFHDDAAQRCLTQALLKCDFNLEIELPPDRLCPPVPNRYYPFPKKPLSIASLTPTARLNYVLWIQDIVAALQDIVPFVWEGFSGDRVATTRGLDIGTGASAIYPLLACAREPSWRFIATEIDDLSYGYAQANMRSNGLSDRIQVVKVDANISHPDRNSNPSPKSEAGGLKFGFDRLFSSSSGGAGVGDASSEGKLGGVEIQFTMCNPPFYSSAEDVAQSEAGKALGAFGACTGAPVEMITPGGEAQFVGAMVRESVPVRTMRGEKVGAEIIVVASEGVDKGTKRRRIEDGHTLSPDTTSGSTMYLVEPDRTQIKTVRWYTSMLGKMSSVVEVVGVFKELEITNYAITEFVQGQTRRWAVGWSVGPWRLGDDIARIANPNPTLQRLLPPRNTLRFVINNDSGAGKPKTRLQGVLADVEDLIVHVQASDAEVHDEADADDLMAEHTQVKFTVSARRDTWSRGARRKRKRGDAAGGGSVLHEVGGEPAFICDVLIRLDAGRAEAKNEVELEVRWLYGWERALLESFASHVAKKLDDRSLDVIAKWLRRQI